MNTDLQQQIDIALAAVKAAFDSNSPQSIERRSREAAFIGPKADWDQIRANTKAKQLEELEAGRPARDAAYADQIARLKIAQDESARIAREGTEYEKACEAHYILDMKECWSAADYAESDRLISIKRNAAANLNIAA